MNDLSSDSTRTAPVFLGDVSDPRNHAAWGKFIARYGPSEQVLVEIVASKEGHLTVFNIGPTGSLNLLYPKGDPQSAGSRSLPSRPLHIFDVELAPPAANACSPSGATNRFFSITWPDWLNRARPRPLIAPPAT